MTVKRLANEHGLRRYTSGTCRCATCRAAMAAYQRRRLHKRAAGQSTARQSAQRRIFDVFDASGEVVGAIHADSMRAAHGVLRGAFVKPAKSEEPKCDCGARFASWNGESTTLVGYGSPPGHRHDDNCLKRGYVCENGHMTILSVVRRCSRQDCEWRGKAACFCCPNGKVDKWPDLNIAPEAEP